jgi:outer membrane protein
MTPRLAAAAAALASLAIAHASFASSPPPATPAPSPTPLALTLSQAEDIAIASSPALALARGQLAQAQAGIGEARSGALPNLAGAASTSHSKSTVAAGSFGNNTSITNLSTQTSASLTLRQLIIDGGHIHDEVESAKYSTDSASLELARQVQSVEFNVAQAYYATLQARHQLATALDSLNLAQVQERLVEAQFKAGVASKADVLTAQLPVAQAQLAVAQAANGEATQAATLLDTMGLSSQTPVTVADEAPSPVTLPPLTDVLTTATSRRPDLLAAVAQKDAADAGVRAARLGLFPNVSGSASTSTSSSKNDSDPGSGSYSPAYSVGLTLSIPIFDGGLTRALTASAQAADDQAAANLQTTQLLVSLNVQQSFLGVQTAQASLTAADAALAQAHTVLDVTNAQYKAGVTTLPLLLSAQVGLSTAEAAQVSAVYAYKTAWQQLLLSEGTIGGP